MNYTYFKFMTGSLEQYYTLLSTDFCQWSFLGVSGFHLVFSAGHEIF